MIGNDIVDLALAREESNWRRARFLDKIFTIYEQDLIANAADPEVMVWNLWSRKEAAYKIYNRETGIRGFFPSQLECLYQEETLGIVSISGKKYFTKTTLADQSIYTIAVTEKKQFKKIKNIRPDAAIGKNNGIPFIIDPVSLQERPVSITHHGAFWQGIVISD